MKTQRRYILKEEISISRKEIVALPDNLGDFLRSYEQARKSTQLPLLGPKIELGSTLSEDNLFAHCYGVIRENSNSQIHLSFPFVQNDKCVFSIKNSTFTETT